jgi:hypothetical protein
MAPIVIAGTASAVMVIRDFFDTIDNDGGYSSTHAPLTNFFIANAHLPDECPATANRRQSFSSRWRGQPSPPALVLVLVLVLAMFQVETAAGAQL